LHHARDTSLLGGTDGKRNAFCEYLKDAFLTITARLLNKAAPLKSRCHDPWRGRSLPRATGGARARRCSSVAARDKRARVLAMTLKRPNRIACRDEFCWDFQIMNQNQIGIRRAWPPEAHALFFRPEYAR
jgi:hypothetical protein